MSTIDEIVASGLMKSRTASGAIQYAVEHKALRRVARRGGRVQYCLTGRNLPTPRPRDADASFDGLLEAWGIAREPVNLPSTDTRLHQISDH